METVARNLGPRNWTRKKIKLALKAAGLKQADLVRELGKSHALVSEVISGQLKSLPVATAVAAALGLHPHQIWPRLYAPPSAEPTTAPTSEPDPGAIARAS